VRGTHEPPEPPTDTHPQRDPLSTVRQSQAAVIDTIRTWTTVTELAECLDVGEDEVLEGLAAVSSRQEVSLDQPVGDADLQLGDLLPAPGAKEEPEDLLALPGLVSVLPELERKVIVLRFFQDLDQYEIAARVGFSQMHVSRLQRRALARMRAQLVEP
jgi:RNA polymerase sigma-B factor